MTTPCKDDSELAAGARARRPRRSRRPAPQARYRQPTDYL